MGTNNKLFSNVPILLREMGVMTCHDKYDVVRAYCPGSLGGGQWRTPLLTSIGCLEFSDLDTLSLFYELTTASASRHSQSDNIKRNGRLGVQSLAVPCRRRMLLADVTHGHASTKWRHDDETSLYLVSLLRNPRNGAKIPADVPGESEHLERVAVSDEPEIEPPCSPLKRPRFPLVLNSLPVVAQRRWRSIKNGTTLNVVTFTADPEVYQRLLNYQRLLEENAKARNVRSGYLRLALVDKKQPPS